MLCLSLWLRDYGFVCFGCVVMGLLLVYCYLLCFAFCLVWVLCLLVLRVLACLCVGCLCLFACFCGVFVLYFAWVTCSLHYLFFGAMSLLFCVVLVVFTCVLLVVCCCLGYLFCDLVALGGSCLCCFLICF